MNVHFYLRNIDTDMSAVQGTLATSNKSYYSQLAAEAIDATAPYWTKTISMIVDMDASDTATVAITMAGGTDLVLGADDTVWSGMLIG